VLATNRFMYRTCRSIQQVPIIRAKSPLVWWRIKCRSKSGTGRQRKPIRASLTPRQASAQAYRRWVCRRQRHRINHVPTVVLDQRDVIAGQIDMSINFRLRWSRHSERLRGLP
jgi:hypothetical protein